MKLSLTTNCNQTVTYFYAEQLMRYLGKGWLPQTDRASAFVSQAFSARAGAVIDL